MDAEIAYSEWMHRVSGLFLLAIVATTLRERRPGARPILSAPIWLVFGLFVFLVVDARAWPLGEQSLEETLADHEAVQHKLFSLIPMAIGVAAWLTGAGWLDRRHWRLAAAALALAGGVGLLVHVHGGHTHLVADRVYLQHAIMAAGTFALCAAALVAARLGRLEPVFARAWPALLAFVAVALLAFREA